MNLGAEDVGGLSHKFLMRVTSSSSTVTLPLILAALLLLLPVPESAATLEAGGRVLELGGSALGMTDMTIS